MILLLNSELWAINIRFLIAFWEIVYHVSLIYVLIFYILLQYYPLKIFITSSDSPTLRQSTNGRMVSAFLQSTTWLFSRPCSESLLMRSSLSETMLITTAKLFLRALRYQELLCGDKVLYIVLYHYIHHNVTSESVNLFMFRTLELSLPEIVSYSVQRSFVWLLYMYVVRFLNYTSEPNVEKCTAHLKRLIKHSGWFALDDSITKNRKLISEGLRNSLLILLLRKSTLNET